jgi:hypothetical protein
MKIAGWIIWGVGAAAFLCAIAILARTIPRGAFRRGYGWALSVFALGSSVALASTVLSSFSRLHLLWILPAALYVSLIVGARRTAATGAHPDQLAGTSSAVYFRAN